MISSPLIYGNWKMHKTVEETQQFVRDLLPLVDAKQEGIALFPPFTALAPAAAAVKDSAITIGAQTLSEYDKGAFTGEISAPMLLDLGIKTTLMGHSERRHICGERCDTVMAKLKAAQRHGMRSVFCVGETEEERNRGDTEKVILYQLDGLDSVDNLVIAYEPVWAIGTGHVATPEMANAVHSFIREQLTLVFKEKGHHVPIIYGGSVKSDNISSLIAARDIDGVLVGGASLEVESFASIINQARGK